MHIIGLSITCEVVAGQIRATSEQHDTPVFGPLRYAGWADAFAAGLASRLTVIGGMEPVTEELSFSLPAEHQEEIRAHGDWPNIPRGLAACLALSRNYHIPRNSLDYIMSPGHTLGNIQSLKEYLPSVDGPHCLSPAYHQIPRVILDAHRMNVKLPEIIPAEAFTVAKSLTERQPEALVRDTLAIRMGDGELARRVAMEITGIAHKILGTYQPRSR